MIVLMHVSDLHVGGKMLWVGSTADRWAGRRPAKRPHFHGHDEKVADDLSNECGYLCGLYPDLRALVTGDLTRLGKGAEFGLAHRFIHATWRLGPFDPLSPGLRMGGDRALTIPGNHDFWAGVVCSPALNRGVLEPHFWPLPWLHVLEDRRERLEVHLVGLDSCSGLWHLSPGQAAARGAIDHDQLTEAGKLLALELARAKLRANKVLRVVLVHHPPHCLAYPARVDFLDWLDRNKVAVILTGHTHERLVPQPQQTRPFFELRCGTTLQAGTYNQLPGLEPNHFFLHAVRGAGPAQAEWRTVEYWHNGAQWTTSQQPVWGQTLAALP
jgi:3',5'-cyclic AMP phosphodiesterase CpdA